MFDWGRRSEKDRKAGSSARASANAELIQQKLRVAADLLAVSEERAKEILLHRAIGAMPRNRLDRYLLPLLSVKSCERVGQDLVRIVLDNGRVFFGHRSEQSDYLLYRMLTSVVPRAVSADAYKLAIDIHSRYLEGALPWYFQGSGVYIEGGCFTGLKAIKWSDALGEDNRILAVEIGASNHDILKMNVEANNLLQRVIPVHAGLWRESGSGVQKHSFTTRRFLESTDRWKEQLLHEEPVRLLTIDDLLDHNQVETARYLNIQVNGAEIEVIKGLGNLERVKVVDVAAYYSKDGVRNVDVIKDMLIARGCRVLHESKAGRIAFVTPKHVDEIMALKP
jgi:FkbM family methyltransferase